MPMPAAVAVHSVDPVPIGLAEEEMYQALGLLMAKLDACQPSFQNDDVVHPQFPPMSLFHPVLTASDTPLLHSHSPTSPSHSEASCPLLTFVDPRRVSAKDEPDDPPTKRSLAAAPILELVQRFDAEYLRRARRSVGECLRIVQRAFEFVLPTSRSVVGGGDKRSSTTNNTGTNGTRCLMLLDKIVQSLIVYANDSEPLRSTLQSDHDIVRMLCTISLEARRREAVGGDEQNIVTLRPPLRSVDELGDFVQMLQEFSVAAPVAQSLVEVYTLEMLLDAALPPAVCTSKFEGATNMLLERKGLIAVEITNHRHFVAHFLQRACLAQVYRLVVIGLYATVKQRMRLYDKMVSEGILSRLSDVVQFAAEGIVSAPGGSNVAVAPSLTPEGINAAMESVHEALDILLCITSIDLDAYLAATSDGQEPSGSRARSTSRGCHGGKTRVCLWAHADWLPVLTRTAENLMKLLDQTQHAERELLQPCSTSQPKAKASDELRWRSKRRPAWLMSPLIEKINEFIGQVINASEAHAASVAQLVDTLFDRVSCDAVPLLLPVVLKLLRKGEGVQHESKSLLPVSMMEEWFLTVNFVPWLFVATGVSHKIQSTSTVSKLAHSLASKSSEAWTLNRVGDWKLLPRHLNRHEIRSVLPFLSFAHKLVTETTWRRGTKSFLQRVLLVAQRIVDDNLMRSRRGTIALGVAWHCMNAIKPIADADWGLPPSLFGDSKAPGGEGDSVLRTILRHKNNSSTNEVIVASPSPPPLNFGKGTTGAEARCAQHLDSQQVPDAFPPGSNNDEVWEVPDTALVREENKMNNKRGPRCATVASRSPSPGLRATRVRLTGVSVRSKSPPPPIPIRNLKDEFDTAALVASPPPTQFPKLPIFRSETSRKRQRMDGGPS